MPLPGNSRNQALTRCRSPAIEPFKDLNTREERQLKIQYH